MSNPSGDPSKLVDELRATRRALQSVRFQAEDAHDQRKYSYSDSNNELGYRLVLGGDPARVPDEELEDINPISARSIRSLLSDEDCPLYRIKIGGSAFVTEVTVQQYERYIAEGDAPGYMDPDPR